jgi:leucyl/phenylalanyl-tRNA---protein transferase
MRTSNASTLLPESILLGYHHGFFPMADAVSGEVLWHRPNPRAVFFPNQTRIHRSVRKAHASGLFRITMNVCFGDVVEQCANREETWINPAIVDGYCELHSMGRAHSIEVWIGNDLVGGLYGLAIAGAFFGESMFSYVSNASKVAFAELIGILQRGGFVLLDSQYINSFTEQLGAVEISDAQYSELLQQALTINANIYA